MIRWWRKRWQKHFVSRSGWPPRACNAQSTRDGFFAAVVRGGTSIVDAIDRRSVCWRGPRSEALQARYRELIEKPRAR
jgi:hypothetical protein